MAYIINNEDVEAVKKAILSKRLDRYILGDGSITRQFECSFAKKINSNNALAVSSGTAALICALKAMHVDSDDEIIIPSHTYIATALAVLAVGAKPIIADIDDSLTIDPYDVEAKITSKTKAIIPVHMRGLPCKMDSLQNLAKKNSLLILEDVAQACGGTYKGKYLGTIGDAGAFSFNHYKILTCGEGGALITNNEAIYKRAKIYHHGGIAFDINNKDEYFENNNILGVNYRMSEISSAMLLTQLERIDYILHALRAEKKIILEELSIVKNIMQPCPINDFTGDCSTGAFFLMPTDKEALNFVDHANHYNISAYRVNTPGHHYHDWVPLLNSKDHPMESCLKSKLILERVVGIPTKIDRNYEELIQTLQKIILIARKL